MKQDREHIAILFVLALALHNCGSVNHYVVASTGTVIGLEMSSSAATQSPSITFGYKRGEIALVPTDAVAGKIRPSSGAIHDVHGASRSTNVLMDIRYQQGNHAQSGIYQRLAVGDQAVQSPVANLMMIRDASGTLDTNASHTLKHMLPKSLSITQVRDAEFVKHANQTRVDAILDQVENLSDESILQLVGHPPSVSNDVNMIFQQIDPTQERFNDPALARRCLKMLVALNARDRTTLKAWEEAIAYYSK